MRTTILILSLLLPSCTPTQQPYKPVEWHNQHQQIPPQPKTQPPLPLPPPPPEQPKHFVTQLLELHNQQRTLKGRAPLQLDDSLNQFAQQWAEHMANKNRLYHSNLDFMKSNKFFTGGENIAWNQTDPQHVTNAWMNSPGHRANILNTRFSKVGFGLVYNSRQEPYWCAVFAAP